MNDGNKLKDTVACVLGIILFTALLYGLVLNSN